MALRKLRAFWTRDKAKSGPLQRSESDEDNTNDDGWTAGMDMGLVVPLAPSSRQLARHGLLRMSLAFCESSILMTALESRLFTVLSQYAATAAISDNADQVPASVKSGLTLETLTERLGWCGDPTLARRVCEALVAMDLLIRQGHGALSMYSNTIQAERYLVEPSPAVEPKSSRSVGATLDTASDYVGDLIFTTCGTGANQSWSSYRQTLQTEDGPRSRTSPPTVKGALALFVARMNVTRVSSKQARQRDDAGAGCNPVDVRPVLQMAWSLIPSSLLRAAVELDLFRLLHSGGQSESTATTAATTSTATTNTEPTDTPLTTLQIHNALLLKCSLERTVDFLEALVRYGLLQSEISSSGKKFYRNAPMVARLVLLHGDDDNESQSLNGFLDMVCRQWHERWAALPDRLANNSPMATLQLQSPASNAAARDDEERSHALEVTLKGWSSFYSECHEFLARYASFWKEQPNGTCLTVVNGGLGQLAWTVARHQPHIDRVITTDRVEVGPLARAWIRRQQQHGDELERPIHFVELNVNGEIGDYVIPSAHVVVLCGVLPQCRTINDKKRLVQRAFDALLPVPTRSHIDGNGESKGGGGGVLVMMDMISDVDNQGVDRLDLCFSLQQSLEATTHQHMTAHNRHNVDMSGGGLHYTESDLQAWCREAGFVRVESEPVVNDQETASTTSTSSSRSSELFRMVRAYKDRAGDGSD